MVKTVSYQRLERKVTTEEFLLKLNGCATLEEGLTVMAKMPHSFTPLDNRPNKQGAGAGKSRSINAIIECVTNGHDANIRLWRETGRFKCEPVSVTDALLKQIEGDARPETARARACAVAQGQQVPQEYGCHRHRRRGRHDGREPAQRAASLWAGGQSPRSDAVRDHSGQGGASIFGHCRFSLIITRAPQESKR